MVTKLEAVIPPNNLDAIKGALIESGIDEMTICHVCEHGRTERRTMHYRGNTYEADLLPGIKIEMVLTEDQVDTAVDIIVKIAGTGKVNDGKIFLSKIDDAIRIRNQQRGVAAL